MQKGDRGQRMLEFLSVAGLGTLRTTFDLNYLQVTHHDSAAHYNAL